MVDGNREGRGRIIRKDGDAYEGDWKANFRHGKGVVIIRSRGEYRRAEGTFEDEIMVEGKIYYRDATYYQG